MNVSEAIFDILSHEVDTVFFLPGGGCGPLVDALGRSELHAVSCLDEQGAGYAAVGYAQHRGFGVCLVTSGPGATNAITPCMAAWLDSVPVLFISGQVQQRWLSMPGMRSRGTQEGPTLAMVEPITKWVFQPDTAIRCIAGLKITIAEAKRCRQGPVWLDIPLDVQGMEL
jgi:acetolactate synthase-1/2/3 large subunit